MRGGKEKRERENLSLPSPTDPCRTGYIFIQSSRQFPKHVIWGSNNDLLRVQKTKWDGINVRASENKAKVETENSCSLMKFERYLVQRTYHETLLP